MVEVTGVCVNSGSALESINNLKEVTRRAGTKLGQSWGGAGTLGEHVKKPFFSGPRLLSGPPNFRSFVLHPLSLLSQSC